MVSETDVKESEEIAQAEISCDTQEQAASLVAIARDVRSQKDEIDRELKRQAEALKPARATAKNYQVAFDNIKGAVVEWVLSRRQKALELMEKAHELQLAGQAEAAIELLNESDELGQAEPPAGASIAEKWTFEYVDESKVPREFCEPKDSKIRAALQESSNNPPEIPGVRWFKTHVMTIRR